MKKLWTFYCRVFVCLFNAFLTITFNKMLKPPYFLVKPSYDLQHCFIWYNYTWEDCAKRYRIEYYVLGCFWWILKYTVICDSVTCDSVTEKLHFFNFWKCSDWIIIMKLHRKKHFYTNLTMSGTLLKNIFSNSVFVGVKVGDSVTLRNHIFDKLTGSSL